MSWIYELHLVETEFEASGLDAAARISYRMNELVKEALEADDEVAGLLRGPFFKVKASPKNYYDYKAPE